MAPLDHQGIKRLLREKQKMLAARAGPRPEEEEAFGARTARQTVQCWCVGRANNRATATLISDAVSITPSSRISKRSARAMSPMWRARTSAGSAPAARFQNSVLSMSHSFQLEYVERADDHILQRACSRLQQPGLREAALAAGGELECVQLRGCHGWLVLFHEGQDKGRGATEQTMNTHVLHKKNSTIRNKSVT